MKILLAADHAGFGLKNNIKDFLVGGGFQVEDMGASAFDPADNYPEIMLPVAMRIVSDPDTTRAIVFGKSGQGEAIICNRLPGVRAAVYYGGNLDIIRLSREHNNANVLSLGAGFIQEKEAQEAVRLWIATTFNNEERHVKRIDMLDNIQ